MRVQLASLHGDLVGLGAGAGGGGGGGREGDAFSASSMVYAKPRRCRLTLAKNYKKTTTKNPLIKRK